jgi:DNA polymerase III epsilon subunit-like protein
MYPDFNSDKFQAYQWANELISGAYGDWCVLDSETTGLESDAEIIELAIISKYGSTLFNSLTKPTVPVESGARAFHQITDEMLGDAPKFPEVFPKIRDALADKLVVIYNSSFDISKLRHCAAIYNLELPEFGASCAMHWYAQYHGDWHNYWQNYTWKKLPGGNHRALGDAIATFNLIKKMAQPMSCPVDYASQIAFPPRQIGCTWVEWLEISVRLKTDNSYYPQERMIFKLKCPKFGWLKPETNLDYENIDNIEF